MLTTIFPTVAHRYLSLPLFGTVADGFVAWSIEQGYTRGTIQNSLHTLVFMDRFFRRRGIRTVGELTPSDFRHCWKWLCRSKPGGAGPVKPMERFLQHHRLMAVDPTPSPSTSTVHLDSYCAYLQSVRGFSSSTIHHHRQTVAEFLRYLGFDKSPRVLSSITQHRLEGFVKKMAHRVNRATLQHVVAELRGYLRFLSTTHQSSSGLDIQIDTPRVYRLEQLPRSLPWSTVVTLLNSINRTTPMGQRDYAMLYLIATYGLRSCEIVSLRLEDIDWRRRVIRIPQTKTRNLLELPLTPNAGAVLVDYLKNAKRPNGYRELFLRMRAPIGILKPTAVAEAFQAWSKHSGLAIPFNGAHCLRHSYAVHLLREGTPLKFIGDLLGHRSAESTAAYIRLSVEDLRDVGLSVPCSMKKSVEVHP